MNVVKHKAAARGVSQLMYVGDTPWSGGTNNLVLVAAVALGAWMLLGRR